MRVLSVSIAEDNGAENDAAMMTTKTNTTTANSGACDSTNASACAMEDDWGMGGGWGSDDEDGRGAGEETAESLADDLEALLKLRDAKQGQDAAKDKPTKEVWSTDDSGNSKSKGRNHNPCFKPWYVVWEDGAKYENQKGDFSRFEPVAGSYSRI